MSTKTSMAFVAAVASAVSVSGVVAEPVAAEADGQGATGGAASPALVGGASVGSAADPVCTAGYNVGPTFTRASVDSRCGLEVQARICRYYGGIICYDGPQAYHSYVSAKTGTLAGHYWRYEASPGRWTAWMSIP